MKKLALLGSTGSIGTQTLEVCARFGYPVTALACGQNVKLLAEQILRFKPAVVSVADAAAAERLNKMLAALPQRQIPRILWGREGLTAVAAESEADILLAAMVGIAGLEPVLEGIRSGKDIALANKEVLVTAGELVQSEVRRCGLKLLPVDSEHSAIWQCLWGTSDKSLRRIFLTASGGPFLHSSDAELAAVTPQAALRHPTWAMGGKITIDSATLMNKGLELIEALHLFDVREEQIEILVHPQSIVHSMVEFVDGSLLAQLSHPDMQLPIQIALAYPERLDTPERLFNPFAAQSAKLEFLPPDPQRFRCLALARLAARSPKSLAIVMNAANELAVEAFLQGRLSFLGIAELVEAVMEKHSAAGLDAAFSLEAVQHFDALARTWTEELLPKLC